MFPEVLRHALMASGWVRDQLEIVRAVGKLQTGFKLEKGASAGAIGVRLEVATVMYFKTYLHLSSFFGRAVPRMQSLQGT